MPNEAGLENAIEKAVEEHKVELGQDRSGLDSQNDIELKQEEEKHEQEIDQDAEQGKLLIQALRDPQKAVQVIDFLATQAGYTKATVQTRQDIKDAKTEINTILEKNLGEEFKFLAPKLAPAIQESLETLLEGHDSNADLRERLDRQELRSIQDETARTHVTLANEWFGQDDMPTNVIKAMSQAMDEFPPTDPDMAPERYYRKIFSLVVGDLGLQKRGRASEKIIRNRTDDLARNLSSQNRGITPNVNGNPKRMNINDAVSLAMEQVRQSNKRG